jgi:hypothetical protein
MAPQQDDLATIAEAARAADVSESLVRKLTAAPVLSGGITTHPGPKRGRGPAPRLVSIKEVRSKTKDVQRRRRAEPAEQQISDLVDEVDRLQMMVSRLQQARSEATVREGTLVASFHAELRALGGTGKAQEPELAHAREIAMERERVLVESYQAELRVLTPPGTGVDQQN